MSEYDWEPVRGLPGRLPQGEHILWQGSPDWRSLARSVFHSGAVTLYFAALLAFGIVSGSLIGALATAAAGALCLALLALLAWATARTTIYTLTNRRVVLRVGVALPKCFNFPLRLVTAADLHALPGGKGDIALTMSGGSRIGYVFLWPHARPWHVKLPQPMLRSVPDAAEVAGQLARACAALGPIERTATVAASDEVPAGAMGVAA